MATAPQNRILTDEEIAKMAAAMNPQRVVQPAPPQPQPLVPSSVAAERKARMRDTPNQGGVIVRGELGDPNSKTVTYAPSTYGSQQKAPEVTPGSMTRAAWHTPRTMGQPVATGEAAELESLQKTTGIIPQAPPQFDVESPSAMAKETFGVASPAAVRATTPAPTQQPQVKPREIFSSADESESGGYQADTSTGIGLAGAAAAVLSRSQAIKANLLRGVAHAKSALPRITRMVAPYIGTAAKAGRLLPGGGAALAVGDPLIKYGSDFLAKRIGPQPEDFRKQTLRAGMPSSRGNSIPVGYGYKPIY